MKQLVQSVGDGSLKIVAAPDPECGPTDVLVRTSHSIVSAGTERAVRQLASASLLKKARARPDLVRQVITRARNAGVRDTIMAVRSRLDEDMPLGYSASGTVIAVGEAVEGIRPGMRVATGGAGHADMQRVAGLLCAPVPKEVSDADASFATVASIALHGLRLADVGTGGSVCVVGLGLIGQLTVRLAIASGLRVFGVDLREWTVERARAAGAAAACEQGDATTGAIREWSRGRGVDAVIITAATSSSAPIQAAPDRLRDRGTVVVVGDIGLELQRTPLYLGEHTVKVARSYGPGRYERSFEEWGVDLPVGYVPFSERRNLEVVLDLIADGRLAVADLVTHSFEFDNAVQAYDTLNDQTAKYLGIQLSFSTSPSPPRPHVMAKSNATSRSDGIALIGAGGFARSVLVPAISASALGNFVAVASASGTSAVKLANSLGCSAMTVDDAITHPDVGLVVVATPHSTHADLVVRALSAGKNVFCEKPLALSFEELDLIEAARADSGREVFVGFNRRHSPDIARTLDILGAGNPPLTISYRVNAGGLPPDHWYFDRREGGRLLGEACHFIDTCNALVRSAPVSVHATGANRGEAITAQDFVATISYENGSVASITYGSRGHGSMPKELIEIMGSGHSIVISDFREFTIDGKSSKHRQDKGHRAQFVAIHESLQRLGQPTSWEAARMTTATTLAAQQSLQSGQPSTIKI